MSGAQGRGRPGPAFWVGAVVGWAVIAYGVYGVFDHSVDTRPAEFARFFIGAAAAHDLLLVPTALVVGGLARRLVRAPWRAPVQAGLIASGAVALFAYPLVRGYGRVHNTPSALPRDYGEGLLVVLAAVWAVVGVVGMAAARRRLKTTSAGERAE